MVLELEVFKYSFGIRQEVHMLLAVGLYRSLVLIRDTVDVTALPCSALFLELLSE